MSEISLILVLHLKTNKILNDMAKIRIKSEKLTPFGGIFAIMEQFNALLSQTIDSTLGLRSKFYGYQYSEILRSWMCVYFCGGSCVEDVTTHLMKKHLSLHPTQTYQGSYAQDCPPTVSLLRQLATLLVTIDMHSLL